MRIVHLSTSDQNGGAARYTYRLHRALVEAGVDSRLIVSQKSSNDPTVSEAFPPRGSTLRRRVRERLERLPLRFYPRRPPTEFSLNWAPNGAWRAVVAAKPDVVHLHWIQHGFFPFAHLRRLRTPLVWSLADYWPFTGGCHYSGDCRRFEHGCGACPQLGSHHPRDLSARLLRAKRRAWQGLPMHVICLSQDTMARARTSSLFASHPMTVLPLAVDTRIYRPIPAAEARRLLGLEADAFIVIFGAARVDDRRKGFDLAQAALASLTPAGTLEKIILCTFGDWPVGAPNQIGAVPVRHLGRLHDDLSIALAFSAADAALVPSREDTGPLILVEALACGTPVVGFPVGATADLVQHRQNGFLATPFEPSGLADGLRWAAGHRGEAAPRDAARETVVRLADTRAQVPRYLEIYAQARAGHR
jgi:glycosyltransferase involved in cell wall biosynthesis